MSWIYPGATNYTVSGTYLTVITYGISGITLSMSILQGRVLTKEISERQQALDMKRMFVRYVSHEVRTPLNTVFMGLDVLKNDLEHIRGSSEAIETVKELKESCNIAIDILNDLLDYEKLEAGLMTLERKRVDSGPFLIKLISSFNVQARQASLNLTLIPNAAQLLIDLRHINIFIDENKMSQVIRNILSNALKFTPQDGSVHVLIKVDKSQSTVGGKYDRNGDEEDIRMTSDRLVINVIDTGVGISKENLSKVFNDIIQFSPGRLQQGGGSGLGLWISKKIVDLHDGHISVTSDGEGCGCNFTLEIPIHEYELNRRVKATSSRVFPSPSLLHCASESIRTSSPPDATSVYMSHGLVSGASISHNNEEVSRSKSERVVDEIGRMNSLYLSDSCHHNISEDQHDQHDQIDRTDSITNISTTENQNINIRNTLHLMVVDDAVVTRKMICRALRSKGYKHIIEAVDGQDALTQLIRLMIEDSQVYIQAVLMDYQMPQMDGPTAAKLMRSNGYKGVIIGVTGNALPADIQRFLSDGANSVLTKPVGIELLDNEILTRCTLNI
eukprot:CAMPEP_0182424572 /NCGR_PEP_ID=MMETSP1167-20130531/10775_1 /TAXON_ID=2988 /ORGANISM="Mallomonas Sp, Strain CCMP3275" /LENGTH=557 /DNA_ID=CAMNT_0024604463 /DNA_START=625 /DNA_END=2298 /DNA_ORIENTATION=-